MASFDKRTPLNLNVFKFNIFILFLMLNVFIDPAYFKVKKKFIIFLLKVFCLLLNFQLHSPYRIDFGFCMVGSVG